MKEEEEEKRTLNKRILKSQTQGKERDSLLSIYASFSSPVAYQRFINFYHSDLGI